MILILLALGLLILLGLPMALLIDPTLRRGTLAGISFLLGCGAAYVLLFAFSMLGIPWSRGSVLTGSFVLLLTFTILLPRRLRTLAVQQPERFFTPGAAIADALTAGLVLNHGLYAAEPELWDWARWVPLWRRDFWGIWGLKAKLFFEARGIDWSVLERPLDPITHPDYPLVVPLGLDYVALIAGAVEDPSLGIFFTAFGAALLLILRDAWLRETGSPQLAAVATLVMTPAALTIYIGLAEGPLIAYSGAALLLLRQALHESGRSVLLPVILLGLATVTKNEGTTLFVAVVVALAVQPARRWRLWKLWPSLVLIATWVFARIRHGLNTDLFENFSMVRVLARIAGPGQLASLAGVPSLEHQFFWLVVAASLALARFERLRRESFLLVTVAVQLVFFGGSYLISPHSLGWHVSGSWGRLVAQLAIPLSFVGLRAVFDFFPTRSDVQAPRLQGV